MSCSKGVFFTSFAALIFHFIIPIFFSFLICLPNRSDVKNVYYTSLKNIDLHLETNLQGNCVSILHSTDKSLLRGGWGWWVFGL